MPLTARQDAPSRTIAIILAGGRGCRLMNLTDRQAKPAVPFGGHFRIVDFTLSNCVNSGFRRIYVMTQYQANSLEKYLKDGWGFLGHGRNRFLEIRSALREHGKIYKGTADAVYQNLEALSRQEADWVLILAGDHIYKMDYAAMLAEHIETGADLTIPCIEVDRMSATAFGVMQVDAGNRVEAFLEKPTDPPGIPGNPDKALASMGIYIFNRKFLEGVLRQDADDEGSSHDFGKDIVPYLVPKAKVMAHRFSNSCVRHECDGETYWRDVGTVDAYWAANMDLMKSEPSLNLHDPEWPIFTASEHMPPAQFVGRAGRALTVDNVISNGCVIEAPDIRRSLLSSGVQVYANSNIDQSVLLPDVTVGANVRLSRAIVDRGCHLPAGLVVGEDAEEDARRFYRTGSGVVLINNQMISALG